MLLAAVSIMYELILMKLGSIFIGGTFSQYVMTLGIFTSALGMGALAYSKINIFRLNKIHKLIWIENILVASIVTSVMLFFIIPQILLPFTIYLSIFIIGFLSGIEIPILMDIKTGKDNSFEPKIFFYDYFGFFIGIFLYSYLIKFMGIFDILISAVVVNLVIAILIRWKLRKILYIFIILGIVGVFYVRNEQIHQYIQYIFIGL